MNAKICFHAIIEMAVKRQSERYNFCKIFDKREFFYYSNKWQCLGNNEIQGELLNNKEFLRVKRFSC